jgi:hypothetical protein
VPGYLQQELKRVSHRIIIVNYGHRAPLGLGHVHFLRTEATKPVRT